MSAPRRWLDGGDDAPEGALSLLESAKKSRRLTASERVRVGKRVAKLASVPIAAGSAMLWMKAVAAAIAVSAASVGVVTALPAFRRADVIDAPPPTRAPVVGRSRAASADIPPPPPPSESSEPEAEPATERPLAPEPVKSRPVKAAMLPPPSDPRETLERESQALSQAHASLANDPANTLRLLDEQALLFPHGQLSDEREVLAVDALRRLGRKTEAKKRGEALLQRSPSGLHADRVRALLAPLP